MIDKEQVIRGLERCAGTDCTGCPYQGISPCQNKLAEDAIALLKEQEARWIPVTERLPEKNGYYLTYVKSALYFDSYYQNLIRFIDGDFIEDHVVIHRQKSQSSHPDVKSSQKPPALSKASLRIKEVT